MGAVRDAEARTRQALLAMLEDLKRERQVIGEARRQWTETVDSVRDPLMVHDEQGGVVRANRAYAERAGMTFRELIGRPYWECFPKRDGPLAGEEEITAQDGRIFVSRVFGVGAPPAWSGHVLRLFEDVTDRRHAERELRESERRLATLMADLPGMAYRCRNDADWTMEFVSEGCHALTGYAPEDLRGSAKIPYGDLIVAEDRDAVWEGVQAALAGRRPFELSYRIRAADGSTRAVWEQGRGVYAPDGTLAAIEGFISDVTEKRRLAEAAEARTRRTLVQAEALGGIVSSQALASGEVELLAREITEALARCAGVERANVWLFNEDETELRCIDGYEATPARHSAGTVLKEAQFGNEFDALKHAPYVSVEEPLTDPRTAGYAEGYLKPLGITSMLDVVVQVARKPLGLLRLEHVGTAHHWEDDEIAFARQVADRIALALLNRDRRAAHERLRMLVESAPLAIYTRNRDGLIASWNPAAERMFGWSAAEVLGRTSPWLPEAERPASDALRARLLAGESFRQEVVRKRRDGSDIELDAFMSPLRDGAGGIEGTISVVADVTEARRAAQALRESEARFRSLTELSSDFYWESDAGHRLVERNSSGSTSAVGIFNDGRQLGKLRWELPYLSPGEAGWDSHRADLDAHRPIRDFEFSRKGDDGAERFVSVSGDPVFDEAGAFTGYRGVGKDITERKRAQQHIERQNRVLSVLSGINSLIVRVHDLDELYREACRVVVEQGALPLAWIAVKDASGENLRILAHAGGPAEFLALLRPLRSAGGRSPGMSAEALASGKVQVCNDISARSSPVRYASEAIKHGFRSIAALPVVVAGEPVAVLTIMAGEEGFFDHAELRLLEELARDIAFAVDHIAKEKKVEYLAYYDALTGLPRSALFMESIGRLVEQATGEGRACALVVGDLERFRNANDTLGRAAGDALLVETARRLGEAFGPSTQLARMHADVFALLLVGVEGADAAARSVRDAAARCFSAPLQAGGREVPLDMRFGVALSPADGTLPEALFRNAESALKRAKESGERLMLYSPEMNARVAEQLALEGRLRRAIEEEQFQLYYQPKWDARSGALTGLEALLRWDDPQNGIVAPGLFVPLLEQTGLILPVGAWVLRRAVRQAREWRAAGLTVPRIAVNVSALQLRQDDFVASVLGALEEDPGVPCLDVEITESLIMTDVARNIAKLKTLREAGVGIAIDDFGTGYSSLAYISRLPIDTLKIDRSFVVAMPDSADDMGIVSAIIMLAHQMGLKAVAEGVDSEEQAKLLRLLKCDQMQGYLFAKPMPAAEVAKLLTPGVTPGVRS